MSWQNSTVAFGRGADVGQDQMLSWRDPHPKPVVQAYLSTGDDSTGHWQMFNLGGM